jgi:glutaredoxin 3
MYATRWCPYCAEARRLLAERGIVYAEIDVGEDAARRAEMAARAEGRRTVPQILIDGRPIGGCAELQALADAGGLQGLAS